MSESVSTSDGRETGLHHHELSEFHKEENFRKAVSGMKAEELYVREYWTAYAKAAELPVETTPTPKDGRGWRGDSEGHAAAGRIGGAAAAAIPGHMAAAGRKGGRAVAEKLGREHMAAIGRKGGSRSSRAKDDEVL